MFNRLLAMLFLVKCVMMVFGGCPAGETCIPKDSGNYPDALVADVNACKGVPQSGTISASQIAAAWKIGGGNPADCAAALIIASGECQPPPQVSADALCDIAGSGAGGVWQVTSPQGAVSCNNPGSNTCCNVVGVKNHFTAPPTGQAAWNAACNHNTSAGTQLTSPDIVPTDHSGGGLGGSQYNWIGPFCHCGIFHNGNPQKGFSGDQWGGGSLWVGGGHGDQAYPYPYYYFDLFNQRVLTKTVSCPGLKQGAKPAAALQTCLNNLVQTALDGATKICAGYSVSQILNSTTYA